MESEFLGGLSPAYLAGFFDGEGTVQMTKKGLGKSCILVCISNTNLLILENIWLQYGGNMRTEKRIKPNHKERYTLAIHGRLAEKFINDIFPYSIIKTEQLSIAREFLRFSNNPENHVRGGRFYTPEELEKKSTLEKIRQKMKSRLMFLNHRGVVVS